MAIQQGIWCIHTNSADSNTAKPQRLITSRLDDENLLEKLIVHNVSIISQDWLLIGRQVRTAFDKRIDLLAPTPKTIF